MIGAIKRKKSGNSLIIRRILKLLHNESQMSSNVGLVSADSKNWSRLPLSQI